MEYTLIIDSGIGGLNQLELIRKDFPQMNLIYFADNKFCPYGNKSNNFLINRSIQIINNIKNKFNIKTVILACNTLSSCAIPSIKKCLNLKVYGTTPPLLKDNNSLLICTQKTAQNLYKKRNSKKVTVHPVKDLASLIENFYPNPNLFNNFILNKLPNITKFKTLILGCTHYTYIIDCFKKINPRLKIVDSNILSYIRYKPYLINKGKGKLFVLASKPSEEYLSKIELILKNKQIFKFQIINRHIDC